jgi:hypothetical protein
MKFRNVLLTAALFVALAPSRGLAQAPPPAPDPAAPGLAQLGPFSLRPTLILRDVGYDSNVHNQASGALEDFTATVGARLDVGLNMSRLQGRYSTMYEYVHFAESEAERGSNRGFEGRIDVPFGRFQPYVGGGLKSSHDRPTAEIDERARRQEVLFESGLRVAAFSRTAVHAGFRRIAADYSSDEIFRGVNLAEQFNGASNAVTFGADVELTPLTTVSVHGERTEERFEFASTRDADSYRVGATATLNPLALISGRASVGMRAFRPLGGQLRDFTGLTAAVAVAYTFPDETRLNVWADRDLRYSYAQLLPYYISTGGRFTLLRQLVGRFDAQVFGGAERIAYEARTDLPAAMAETDRVRTFGTGVGYRVGNGARLGLNVDYTIRSSPAADREYARQRVYTTLTYGF